LEFDGRQMSLFDSSKFVTVTPATLQGFEANYAHYANARVNRGDPNRRPLFLRDPIINTGKSKRGGRRHGKSMIDVALRSKEKKAAAVAKAAIEETSVTMTTASAISKPHIVLPPMQGVGAMQTEADGHGVQQRMSARRVSCSTCGGQSCAGDKFCTFCGSALA
jgi:hypothetical protein